MGNGSASGHSPDARISEESSSKRLPAQQYGGARLQRASYPEAVFSNQYYLTTSGPICSDLKKRCRNRSKEYFRNSEVEGIVIPKGGKATEEEPFRVFEPEAVGLSESVENIPGDCFKTVVSEKSSSLRMQRLTTIAFQGCSNLEESSSRTANR